MCKHVYKQRSWISTSQQENKVCAYLEILTSQQATNPELFDQSLSPPIDPDGMCIFHSTNTQWKRKQDFIQWFHKLLTASEASDENEIDLEEVAFYGAAKQEQDAQGNAISPFKIRLSFETDKAINLQGAVFFDDVELENLTLTKNVNFGDATFLKDLKAKRVTFSQTSFSFAKFKGDTLFEHVHFPSHTSFTYARFHKGVKFIDCTFEHITDFSYSRFLKLPNEHHSTIFERNIVRSSMNFYQAQMDSPLVIKEVSFHNKVEFLDTVFNKVEDTYSEISGNEFRLQGCSVLFFNVTVQEPSRLIFRSSNKLNKIFTHDVYLRFKEVSGVVEFENVNFLNIEAESRNEILRLSKQGNVIIGPGCIKYRHQSGIRTIEIESGNQPLILEIAYTYANFFTAKSGCSLGVEIIERQEYSISFFYFSDDNIDKAEFDQWCTKSESNFWNLLTTRIEADQLLSNNPETNPEIQGELENQFISTIDAISALAGTFYRVVARVACGKWGLKDTQALLNAINFGGRHTLLTPESLHHQLPHQFTAQELLNRQNAHAQGYYAKQRSPLTEQSTKEPKQLRILFLAANPTSSHLSLDKEIKSIKSALKSLKGESQLLLEQEWAITVHDLKQAILDYSPNIVHFSGHGTEEGIFVHDPLGSALLLTPEALKQFFELFADSITCVVLNACFSIVQAKAIQAAHIPYVVGMTSSISSKIATSFTTGFYQALRAGKDIPWAFEFAKSSIALDGVGDAKIPILLQ